MNIEKQIRKLHLGYRYNISFRDFVSIIEKFGFRRIRTNGSHNIFKHSKVQELINIQNVRGQAKPYQIKQFFKLVEKYNLDYE